MTTKYFYLIVIAVLVLVPFVSADDIYAGYIPSSVSGESPLTVNFTDISYNTPTAWSWSFRDVTGNDTTIVFSSAQNASHTFNAGNFSIRLFVSNAYGSNTTGDLVFVNVTGTSVPVSGFTAIPVSGSSPLSVSFVDSTTNTPTNWDWYWYANETKSSDLQNPSTTLTTGTYDVRLYTSNDAAGDWENKTDYITVTDGVVAPSAAFTVDHTSGTAPLTTHFTDTSTNYPTSWLWNFDGVNVSYSQDPTHIYEAPGLYTVSLQAQNSAGADTETKTNYINVSGTGLHPTASFTATPDTIYYGDPITFTDTSTNTPTSWAWVIEHEGPGGAIPYDYYYTQNVVREHFWGFTGVHTVSLTASNAYGSNTINGTFTVLTPITPTPTTIVPTPIITPSGSGPQITGWSSLTSNGINLSVTGVYGTEVWLIYGQNSGGYTWITQNFTATGGTATIVLQGSPLFGNTRYFARAVDISGRGNEVEFSTAAITPIPQTTFGQGFKNIVGMR